MKKEKYQSLRKLKSGAVSMIIISVVAMMFLLCSCSAFGPEAAIKKVLADSYGKEGIEVVKTYEFTKTVAGLTQGYTLVLIKDVNYDMVLVNVDEKTIKEVNFKYAPLNVVVSNIFAGDQITNTKHFDMAAAHMEQRGYYGFSNRETAIGYLKKITSGNNGVIATYTAQQLLRNNLSTIAPTLKEGEEYEIIFDGNTAAPKYYASKTSEMRYNWSHIFTEYVYDVWKANTDRSTQNTMIALYGQPYVMIERWIVVDTNLEHVGIYSSKEQMIKELP